MMFYGRVRAPIGEHTVGVATFHSSSGIPYRVFAPLQLWTIVDKVDVEKSSSSGNATTVGDENCMTLNNTEISRGKYGDSKIRSCLARWVKWEEFLDANYRLFLFGAGEVEMAERNEYTTFQKLCCRVSQKWLGIAWLKLLVHDPLRWILKRIIGGGLFMMWERSPSSLFNKMPAVDVEKWFGQRSRRGKNSDTKSTCDAETKRYPTKSLKTLPNDAYVLFSHGLTGTNEEDSAGCIEFASQGYVVIAPTHCEGSSSMVWRKIVANSSTDVRNTGTVNKSTTHEYERVWFEWSPYLREKDSTLHDAYRWREDKVESRAKELWECFEHFENSVLAQQQTLQRENSALSQYDNGGSQNENSQRDCSASDTTKLRKNVSLVGFSYGGATTQLCAVDHYDRVNCIISKDGWYHLRLGAIRNEGEPEGATNLSNPREIPRSGHMYFPTRVVEKYLFTGKRAIETLTEKRMGQNSVEKITAQFPPLLSIVSEEFLNYKNPALIQLLYAEMLNAMGRWVSTPNKTSLATVYVYTDTIHTDMCDKYLMFAGGLMYDIAMKLADFFSFLGITFNLLHDYARCKFRKPKRGNSFFGEAGHSVQYHPLKSPLDSSEATDQHDGESSRAQHGSQNVSQNNSQNGTTINSEEKLDPVEKLGSQYLRKHTLLWCDVEDPFYEKLREHCPNKKNGSKTDSGLDQVGFDQSLVTTRTDGTLICRIDASNMTLEELDGVMMARKHSWKSKESIDPVETYYKIVYDMVDFLQQHSRPIMPSKSSIAKSTVEAAAESSTLSSGGNSQMEENQNQS